VTVQLTHSSRYLRDLPEATRKQSSDVFRARSVSNYIFGAAPVHELEQRYIQHEEDLVTLRPGRDYAWLDQCVQSCLHALHGRVPLIHVRCVSRLDGNLCFR
jgi:hypothetical protein